MDMATNTGGIRVASSCQTITGGLGFYYRYLLSSEAGKLVSEHRSLSDICVFAKTLISSDNHKPVLLVNHFFTPVYPTFLEVLIEKLADQGG
jgi:hypothetical protein